MGRLSGKRVAITGAGQGIGAGVVELFAREGAHLFALSRSLEPMARWAGRPEIECAACDVTDPAAVAAAAGRIGRLDALIAAAGIVLQGSILQASEADLATSLSVNVMGTFRSVKAFLPAMIEGGGGAIVIIASVVSSVAGVPERCVYATSKGALIAMTKSLAVDYAGAKIRCNAVCPGVIDTPSMAGRIAKAADPEAARRRYVDRHKIKRFGTVAEVAEACLYLASDSGAFMTGQALVIDGGMTA